LLHSGLYSKRRPRQVVEPERLIGFVLHFFSKFGCGRPPGLALALVWVEEVVANLRTVGALG